MTSTTGVDRRPKRALDVPDTSLSGALESRDNALNFIRLVLATTVILGHSAPLGGFPHPWLETWADSAVDGFFVLSGFLIAGSRMRLGLPAFLWRRVLRIMPAFWVCIVVVAFVFAPIAGHYPGEEYIQQSAIDYVVANSGLQIHQWGIDNTLETVPFPYEWNSSLWTLIYEFRAYLMAAVVLWLPPIRKNAIYIIPVLAVLFGALAVAEWGFGLFWTPWLDLDGKRFFAFFAAGMALYFLGGRLRSSLIAAGICAVATIAIRLVSYPWYLGVAPLLLGYVLLVLGGRLPVRLGARNDISYGVYIYAFPVQQLLALNGGHTLGVLGFAAASTALTVPLAWASWRSVEEPVMKLGRLVPAHLFKRQPAPASEPEISQLPQRGH